MRPLVIVATLVAALLGACSYQAATKLSGETKVGGTYPIKSQCDDAGVTPIAATAKDGGT